MFLIILGFLIVILSVISAKTDTPLIRYSKLIRIAGIVIIILGASLSMFKVIPAGQVGVKTLYGKVDNDVLFSGLNVINPLVEVTTFDVKTQNYTMSAVHDEGNKAG
ncbi:SPFH domain-containing protein [Pedobacter mendelii]